MSLEVGEIIEGKYRIVGLLGVGGMGAVYEGENVRIKRRVAIKVLHANVAQNSDAVQRFEREAQAAGHIGSNHIVEVLDLGDLPNGDRFMVMEFLEGETLSNRVKTRGRLPPVEVAQIALQMLDGLSAAHGARIIHRDLKPDNVFLLTKFAGRRDFVKVLDFGISKFAAMSGDAGFKMTRTGTVMGTPYYLSPEQAKGAKEVDHRADLYAAGVILYECVTGQVPFDAETFNGLIMKIAFANPEPPERLSPDVDPAFGSIIAKAMAREPHDRFQSADAMREAIERWVATGAKVSIPPSATLSVPSRPAPLPAAGRPVTMGPDGNPIAATANSLAGTPGNWAATPSPLQAGTIEKKKTSPLLIAGLAGTLVLMLAGAGTLIAVLGSRGADTAPAAAESSAAEAESAPAPPPSASTTVAVAPTPEPTPSAAPSETATATATAKSAAAKAPSTKLTAAPATPKAPAGLATTKAGTTAAPTATSGGRKIRTDL